MPAAPEPKAYFLAWRTYGTWLPGDERGWVDERRNGFGEPPNKPDYRLANAARGQMKSPPVELNDIERQEIDGIFRETCTFRGWPILALNVRTNHVHIVVAADVGPAQVMNALKAKVTRARRERGSQGANLVLWARGGSKRTLWNDDAVEAAVEYVLHRQ